MIQDPRPRFVFVLVMFAFALIPGAIRAEEMNLTGNMTVNGESTLSGNLTAGNAVFNVNSTDGRVGIGTATPSSIFHIYKDNNNTENIIFGDSSVMGSVGSDMASSNIQLRLGGFYNNGYNGNDSSPAVKLWIGNYDNDWARVIYPIYVEDENNQLDFFIKNRPNAGPDSAPPNNVNPTMYFAGNVGIGTIPTNGLNDVRLKVSGSIQATGYIKMFNINPLTFLPSGASCIYSSGGRVFAADTFWNNNAISTHVDPNQINPSASTSFSDVNIAYPFSFNQKNPLLGMEQTIDTAKMVAWVEKKMQTELGEEAGRLVFTRDLPTSECLSLSQYQAQQVLDKLETMPWIKVEVAAGGRIPDAAFEEIPETRTVERKVPVTRKEINFETRTLVDVTREETQAAEEPTGRTITRLRSGWELREDGLYRKPTLDDVNLESLLAEAPRLPQWILDRIQGGQQIGMNIDDLTGEIRQILATKASSTIKTAARCE